MRKKIDFSNTTNLRLPICILALLMFFSVLGQESKSTVNVQGKDVTQLKHSWAAQWITHKTAPTLEYGVFLYRRSFSLEVIPSQFIIYVSADNRYRLTLNGEVVSTGPARGDINNWRFEEVDLAPYLQAGENVLAAQVVNFGEFRHAAQTSFQTAFILQGHEDNLIDLNTRPDENWKIHHDEAFGYTPFLSDSVGGYYAAGPGDILFAEKHPWGWEEVSYDDSNWQTPRAATVEFAVGRGFLFGSTWYLVPREIPKMTNIPTRITKVVRAEGIKLPNNIFEGESGVTIPPHTTATIILDQGHHTIGHPKLSFSKGEGSKVKLTYAEAMFFNDSEEYSAHGGWRKGHRNKNLEKKDVKGYYDIVHPDGGDHRNFQPLAMRVYRFVKMDIETQGEALDLDDFQGYYTAYPFEEKSSFSCDDDSLKIIWDVAWRTLKNSSVETFVDPYYEQLQYIGDSRVQAMVAIYVADDDKLMKKAIKSFDDSRLPMGLTASRFPSYIVQVIPTYSLLWIGIMNDFYMYRNEPEYLEQFVPGILTVLDWFERHIDDTNMLANLEWWNFTDWAVGFDNGIPPGADDGHSANVSLQFVYAIENALPILKQFGKTAEADKYEAIAKSMKAAVLAHCQNMQTGLIAERPEKDVYSQHTNIWAILTDVFPDDEAKSIMEKVLSDPELIQGTVYFKFYLVKALQKVGLGDKYMQQLGPWKYMLNQGMTTFGETDKNPRSDCHGWSATPCFDMLHVVAGIQPDSPGYKSVLIEPNFNELHQIDAVYKHPVGEIKVNIKKDNQDHVNGTIELPRGLTGIFKYHGKTIELIGESKINIKK